MNSIRTFAMKPWISKPIIGMWLLWSGMFLCLFPSNAPAAPIEKDWGEVATVTSHQAGLDTVPVECMEVTDEGTDVSCKSEASGTLVLSSDLVKFVAISHDLPDRLAEFIQFRSVSPLVPRVFEVPRTGIYLLFCSFLK